LKHSTLRLLLYWCRGWRY